MLRALVGVVIVAVLVVASVLLWHSWRTGQLQQLLSQAELSRDAWRSSALAHEANAAKQAELKQSANAAVKALQEQLGTQEQAYQKLHQQIQQSQPEDDGPVADVLRNAIEGLP